MSFIKVRLLCLSIIIFSLISGCSAQLKQQPSVVVTNVEPIVSKAEVREASSPDLPRKTTAVIAAVGDIMMHNNMIASGRKKDGTYNYDVFFTRVKPIIGNADYAIANLETPLAGREAKYTGYPRFNSPDALKKSLKLAGFDLISTANNHIMDKGVNGAVRTIKVLQAEGLDTVGGHAYKTVKSPFLIKQINGIKIGFLSYTYGTNSIPVPKAKAYAVDMLEEKNIISDLSKIREEADIVILLLHWGVEYAAKPTEKQVKQANLFLKEGADIILGGHPHVLQPMQKINVQGKNKFVVYSMGNFIGSQRGEEKNSGVVINIKLEKDLRSNTTQITELSYVPTYSYSYKEKGKTQFSVIAIEETIKHIQSKTEKFFKPKDLSFLTKIVNNTKKRVGEKYLIDEVR